MKKYLKFLSLALAFCLSLSILGGCGKTPDTPDGDDNGGGGTTPSQTVAESIRVLEETPYTSDSVTENYGLSNAKNVGVIESETSNVLYGVKADGDFSSGNVINVDSYSGTDDEKMAAALESAKSANVSGDVKIKLPDRTLTLTQKIYFNGFDGLYVEGGENTEILMDCSSGGWIGAFAVQNSKNVHLNNFSIDYKVLPSIVGIVTSTDAETKTITMSIPQSMQSTVDAYLANPKLCATLKSVIQFNRFTGAPDENGITLIYSDNQIEKCEFNGNSEVKLTFKSSYSFTAPVKNTPISLAFTMYDNAGTQFVNSENVYVDNVALYSCPGMGITVSSTTNFYANNFSIKLKNEDRKMTATADGYHIASCLGEVKITNSIIENTHDDALNIKSGYWYSLSGYDSVDRTFTVTKKTSANLMAEVGDIIEFYDSSSFESLGDFTVTAVSGNETTMVLTVKERISGNKDWSKAMMTNVSKVAKFTFTNNIVRNKRNRGLLVQVRDAVISNNAFINVGHGSLQIASSLDVYNEATVPQNVTIENNKFINNGYLLGEGLRGDISCFAIGSEALVAPAGVVKDIEIKNNYISNSGNAGISLRGVGDANVSNNLFYNVARVYISGVECCFELVNCADITIKNNYNYNTNDSATFSGIITGGLTKTDDITLSGNTNIKYQEISGEVPNVQVNKVEKGSITVDGDVSEWSNIGTVVEMDGASETTGDEILHDTYKDVFDVRMAKITWTDDGIYIAFDVYDNKADFKTIANFWEGDGFEFFLSTITDMPNADLQLLKTYQGDVMQLSVVPSWTTPYTLSDVRTNADILAGKDSIKVAAKLKSDGYSGEVFLPFSLFTNTKIAIEQGNGIAMAFVFMDADRDNIGRKRIQVSNVPHFVETYKTKTAKMPLFTFVD